MALSRIGESLKATRERVGWSREALAYHSGVSWSAIAQIESGRRKDVRPGTLAALADALGISVDYLIGTTATVGSQLCEHRLLTYGSDEEFVAFTVPYVAEGIERSHSILAVTTETNTGLLRDALGDQSAHVEFADWDDWYRSPKEALSRYGAFMKQEIEAGAIWIRVVGEAAWAGKSNAEIAAWTRYESLVNLAFASSPATVVCTYDERSFPTEVMADARRTHPETAHGCDSTASLTYRGPEDFLVDPQNVVGFPS